MIKKIDKNTWEGVKFRKFPEYNYSVVWNNLTTIRFDLGDVIELPPEYSEFYDLAITTRCNAGCNFCLTDEMFVNTTEGNKKINEIKTGDTVFSLKHKTNDLEIDIVDQIFQRKYEGDLIEIEMENGNVIKCTPNHRIFTLNRGYVEASQLQLNDTFFLI